MLYELSPNVVRIFDFDCFIPAKPNTIKPEGIPQTSTRLNDPTSNTPVANRESVPKPAAATYSLLGNNRVQKIAPTTIPKMNSRTMELIKSNATKDTSEIEVAKIECQILRK
jgi:hypothetical protein